MPSIGMDMPMPEAGVYFDKLSRQMEASTLAVRNLSEHLAVRGMPEHDAAPPVSRNVTGYAEINEYGWLHIRLNMLLPHCRFQSTAYISDTVIQLLDQLESGGRRIPKFERAHMVIDEHCDIDNRQVYDQDNKSWKALPNAMKGRVFEDDDQFTLHLSLISSRSRNPCCHIYVMDQKDTPEFFGLRYGCF